MGVFVAILFITTVEGPGVVWPPGKGLWPQWTLGCPRISEWRLTAHTTSHCSSHLHHNQTHTSPPLCVRISHSRLKVVRQLRPGWWCGPREAGAEAAQATSKLVVRLHPTYSTQLGGAETWSSCQLPLPPAELYQVRSRFSRNEWPANSTPGNGIVQIWLIFHKEQFSLRGEINRI